MILFRRTGNSLNITGKAVTIDNTINIYDSQSDDEIRRKILQYTGGKEPHEIAA